MLWSVIPYYNLVSCGGSSNKKVAATGKGEDGIIVQSEDDDVHFSCFAKGKYSTDKCDANKQVVAFFAIRV